MSDRKETPGLLGKLSGLTAKVDDSKAPPAPPQKDKPKSDQRVDLKGRVTYQLGPEIKEAIRDESVRLGVPASHLAKYLLWYAWDMYQTGDIPPPTLLPSNSPAYQNLIDFSE